MTPREGVEREAFLRYWGKPSPHDSDLCAVAYAAWLARASLAHPAATAREEAWKAMVEALTYIASHRGLTLLGDGSYSDGVRDGWIELADAADRALALARSVKGTEA